MLPGLGEDVVETAPGCSRAATGPAAAPFAAVLLAAVLLPATVIAATGCESYEFQGPTTRRQAIDLTDGSVLMPQPAGRTTPTSEDQRTRNGLIALYQFGDHTGDIVHDVSGVGQAMNLSIADTGAVTWLGSSLRIDAPTRISSADAARKITNTVRSTGEITIELWFWPADPAASNGTPLFTIGSGTSSKNLALRQFTNRYGFELRTSTTDESGMSLQTPEGSANAALSHVLVSRDTAGTITLYVDGTVVDREESSGALASWDDTLMLHLANEADGSQGWLGELDLLAFYDRALTTAEAAENFRAGR